MTTIKFDNQLEANPNKTVIHLNDKGAVLFVDDDGMLTFSGIEGVKFDMGDKDFKVVAKTVDIQASDTIYLGSEKETVVQSKKLHFNSLGRGLSGFFKGSSLWKWISRK